MAQGHMKLSMGRFLAAQDWGGGGGPHAPFKTFSELGPPGSPAQKPPCTQGQVPNHREPAACGARFGCLDPQTGGGALGAPQSGQAQHVLWACHAAMHTATQACLCPPGMPGHGHTHRGSQITNQHTPGSETLWMAILQRPWSDLLNERRVPAPHWGLTFFHSPWTVWPTCLGEHVRRSSAFLDIMAPCLHCRDGGGEPLPLWGGLH